MSAVGFVHGIDAVEHEVHENLLQLHTVCHHLGKVLGKLGADGDRVAARLAVQQNNHFSNELIYIKQLPPQRAYKPARLFRLICTSGKQAPRFQGIGWYMLGWRRAEGWGRMAKRLAQPAAVLPEARPIARRIQGSSNR